MKEKINVGGPFKTFVSFDYASLYPHTFSGVSLRMLGVKLNRKKVIEQLWGIENKNAYPNV